MNCNILKLLVLDTYFYNINSNEAGGIFLFDVKSSVQKIEMYYNVMYVMSAKKGGTLMYLLLQE